MALSTVLGVVSGLATAGLVLTTGVLEGKLTSKFVDGWVVPWASLFALGGVVVGGVLWAWGGDSLGAWGSGILDSSAMSFGVCVVVAGAGHLALLALPDLLYDPNWAGKTVEQRVEGAVSNVKTIMSFGPGGQLMPFLDLGLWAFGEAETAASSIGEPMAQSLIEQTLAAAAAAKAAAK